MLGNLFARSSEEVRSFSWGTRARRVLLLVLFFAGYFLLFAYHVIAWMRGAPPTPLVEFFYHALVIGDYLLLWLLMSYLFQKRQSAPARVFWTTLVVGVFLLGFGRLVTIVGRPVDLAFSTEAIGFEYNTGVPLTLATVVKMNVLSLVEVSFAFFLLLRFRDLVLFKRSKSSQRNWYLMLGLAAVASPFFFMRPSRLDLGPLGIMLIPAVALMITNSFRLSWIVFLSFKEKVLCIGLSLLLLAILSLGLTAAAADQGLLAGAYAYLTHYSYPLSIFTLLAVVFGILYCTTAFLSLLFHLPTTGDFQQKVGEVAAMHSLTTLVSQVFDPEKLAYTIAASPVEAGSGHGSWLAVADPHSGTLRPRITATHNLTLDQVSRMVDTAAFYEEVYGKRELLLLDQAPVDHRVRVRPGDGLGSLLVMPLLARNEMLGALFVIKDVTHGFEKDDIEAISVFAAQAALALDNARLFEEQIEKERLSRELDIAREVQRKLLPQKLPSLSGITLAASSVSAQEVGGDYYDFLQLDDKRLALIIGDVSGKGTHAAFYMAEMQGIFQSLSRLAPSPLEFLSHANDALSRSLEKHIFISVVYGVLDLDREEVTLARAGHCPVAVINLNGEARFLRTPGLGLGLERSDRFRSTLSEERIQLLPGDVFVFYTDGVVESRNQTGEEYGYERLLASLCRHRYEDAQDLHNALLADLHDFTGHHAYDDDMTLVVLKWHGIRSPDAENAGGAVRLRIEEPVPVLE